MAVQRIIVDVEMVDGTVYEDVKTTIADQALYSKTARGQKWASPQEDPLTFLNFLAYAALRRMGKFSGDWVAFTNEAAAVGDSGSEDVDPTPATTGD